MENESFYFSTSSSVSPEDNFGWETIYESGNGQSIIFRGRRCGKFVVAKALKSEFSGIPAFASLLNKEFEISYNLDHPNICRTFSFENIEPLGDCLIMDWVDGRTLSQTFEENIDKASVKRIFLQICDALEYLHRKQVIHRDLKPSNILITYNGNNVKLIDFGLSDTDAHYAHKEPAGTLLYSSPEQIAGLPLDCRSDIYSLGVIMREFGGRDYARIAAKCTCKDCSSRYENVSLLKQDIEKAGVRRRGAIIAAIVIIVSAVISFYFPRHTENTTIDATELFDMATMAIKESQSLNQQ